MKKRIDPSGNRDYVTDMMMNYKDDDEIVNTFIAETRDHLENIESGILELESHPESLDNELIHEMFRAAHSIKAGANLLEYRNIESLAHSLENILQHLQHGDLAIDQELISLFLRGLDKIRELVDNLSFSDLVNITSFIERLTNLKS